MLQQLPVVSGDLTSGSFGNLSVLAVPDITKGQGVFSAPLTAGGQTDQGYFSGSDPNLWAPERIQRSGTPFSFRFSQTAE